MQPTPLKIPRTVPQQRFRTPKKNIPQTKPERDQVLRHVRNYVAEFNPVPPLPMDELKEHADHIIATLQWDPIYRDYVGVLINNEMWRENLATIPYERRLLLLPKCLRVEDKCPAPFDEFGLLCKQCGLCSIQDLQNEAERLGYAVLVAEGSAIVMSLIQTGKIDAILGVSCLSVLERAFPYMEAAAVPGVAVPLLQDDCIDTTVDLDWIWDYIHLTSDDQTRRLDLTALRNEVDTWFDSASLDRLIGPALGQTETVARQWLQRAGKRWRPFLTVAVFKALADNAPDSDGLKKVAIAVECFHKASLVHDDIEDGDSQRYGQKALHEELGLAVALNVGDLLIGEGYRLIADSGYSPEQIAAMLRVAAEGQRELCRGQGAELAWLSEPAPLTQAQVLDIFRQKTAPAFEVALRFGAICAEQHEAVSEVIGTYSEALGIAYQIRDDIDDADNANDGSDNEKLTPSLLLAIAHEKAKGETKEWLGSVWKQAGTADFGKQLKEVYAQLEAGDRAQLLLETYKEEATRCLREVESASFKGLLRRVIGKIFNDTEIKGWCKEFENKNGVDRSEATEVHAGNGR